MLPRYVNSIRFLLSGFTSSLTLSSKFFATFPHGTCSLSVSWSYLALDEVYHPLWAAISGNPTPRSNRPSRPPPVQALNPLWRAAPLKGTSGERKRRTVTPIRHISRQSTTERFGAGLLPVHSPLLGESLLVSFPPLNYMLKFSGYSRLS